MSSFSQTGLRFTFLAFCDSQHILSWSIPMRFLHVPWWLLVGPKIGECYKCEGAEYNSCWATHRQCSLASQDTALRGSGAIMLETHRSRRTDICPEISGGQHGLFSRNFCVRVSDGLHDHRSCIGSTNFRSACMVTGIFASTSLLPTGLMWSLR